MTDFLPAKLSHSTQMTSQKLVQMKQAADKLEASFLSEMLKSAGLGAESGSFGGGVGEDQFASFKRDALAERMVQGGGIGLSEAFFNALKEKAGE